MDLSSNTPVLTLMIGLAVGIDYALFIVSRYRHELAVGREPQEAADARWGPRGGDPEADAGSPTFGTRWARMIARRPVAVLLAAVAALGVVAIPSADLRLGMPDDGTSTPDTTERKAYDLLASGFGPDSTGRSWSSWTPATATRRPPPPSPRSRSRSSTLLVHAIREKVASVGGATVGVTGLTVIDIDISEKLGDALIPYLCVVVGLAFVLLMLVFRSLLVPLQATVGFLLSIAATFGAVVAVFQWGWLAHVGVEQTGQSPASCPSPDRHRVRVGDGLPGLTCHQDA